MGHKPLNNTQIFFLLSVILFAMAASWYGGMKTQEFIDTHKQNKALEGCEMVASQILKDAIIAEHKFNACNEVIEDIKKNIEEAFR